MSEQKLSKRIERKIVSFFKSLCSYDPASIELKEGTNTIQAKYPQKRKRVTFLFDEVLIKLTRKNIILEQFQTFSYGVALPPSLEKHIAQRTNNITIAVFNGHFSDRAMKSVIYPIKLIQKPLCFLSTGNLILAKEALELREGMVQAYVVEVKEKSCKAIQEMLMKYYQRISRFVFICHEEVKTQQIIEVFKIFRGKFIYELERVMILDKCISSIVYISKSREFLNIDKEALLDFYVSQVDKEHPSLDKKEFSEILDMLLEADFYIEVAATLGELMNRQINRFRDNFMRTITQKFPYVTPFLKGVQIQKATSLFQTPFLEKSIYQQTPLFHVRESTNYPYKYDQQDSEMGMTKMQPAVRPKTQGMSFQ